MANGNIPHPVQGSVGGKRFFLVGIGGSLSGSLTATGSSDYIVHQIQTTGSATAGSTSTMNYQYDETA